MSTALSLDHIGIAGRDLDAMAAAFSRLGFTLTPLARHSGKRTPDGPVVPFGTGNRCVMLRDGYLELIALIDPSAFSNTLDRFLGRYEGIHIVALGIEDAEANLRRLRAAGFELPGIAYLERPVDDADPDGPRARFARLPLPDAPEGRLQLIQHLTPEAIWQERFLGHTNRAVALETLFVATADPADAASRFARLSGVPVVPDPAGGFALALPRGTVRLLPPDALGDVLPGVATPDLPFIAGIGVRTDDGTVAARVVLDKAGVQARSVPGGLLVPPVDGAGAAVLFTG